MHPLTTAPEADWRLALVLVLLLAIAVAAGVVGRIGVARQQVVAAVRAVAQLAAVALVLTAVLRSLVLSFAFVGLMYVVATATSAGRLDVGWRRAGWVGLAIAAGAGPVVALVLGSGVVPLTGTGVIPIAGIVVGNAMTAATLSGRRALDELESQRGALEAALALGLMPTEATYEVVQPTAREALVPGLDQTRTVGLVTLPGAFIGVLLGGGTAVEAAAAQVLVLIGLLAAQAITSAVTLRGVAAGHLTRRTGAPLPR